MSLMNSGPQPPKPGANLAPVNYEVEQLSEGALVAEAMLNRGIELGIIDPSLVEFADSVLGETGRAASLLLPCYEVISRFAAVTAGHNPETRANPLWVLSRNHRGEFTDPRTMKWGQEKYASGKEGYIDPESSTRLQDHSHPAIYATDEAQIPVVLGWKKEQRVAVGKLEQEGPMGEASTLVEPGFGGIDIKNPEHAVIDLSTRMLTTALLLKQMGSSHTNHAAETTLLEDRIQRLFLREHGADFGTFINKVNSAADMIAVGTNIEGARIHVISGMLAEDTARFLDKVWLDLERLVALERLGRYDMGRITKAITPAF